MTNIDPQNLPRHIAIIMDGNGRWAAKHTMGRISGHKKGAESVRETVRACRELGIKCLTLYAFSVQNWLRPSSEVNGLMNLLEEFLHSEAQELIDKGIRLTMIGNIDALRETVKKVLEDVILKTSQNTDMILNLALSYGGRDEIVGAVKKVLRDYAAGKITPENVTEEYFSTCLDTNALPDPDLVIRTSGEYRISNFLLWQSAYTEFYFTDVLWPDFRRDDLMEAILAYQKRERRFGLTSDQIQDGQGKGQGNSD
ncbi:MAG: isoprenyl transferase [Deltaproteobacteria bacterium]|nr:isoprenyl transferase [Deltaproteobacteria bacterium]